MPRIYVFLIILISISAQVQSQHLNTKLPYRTPKNEYPTNFFHAFEKEIASTIPSLGSFAVWRKNALIYEHYFHGTSSSTLFNIKSVTKSVSSALGGIARDKGILPDLNTPVINILTEYAPPQSYPLHVWFAEDRARDNSLRRIMTLKDILTMQTGYQWDDFGPVANAYVSSADPVKFMLEIPYAEEPGRSFNYCSGASTIFGGVLSKLIKSDLKKFAETNLFDPIGITLQRWDKEPTGNYAAASEMFLTTQDMMRFGLLYLHKGKANGRQVISESWINESLAAHATLNTWPVLPNANGYGYYWWRRKTNGHQAYIASGYGGQLVCIIPRLDMVIVTTCLINEKNRGRKEIKLLHSFIDKIVKETKLKY